MLIHIEADQVVGPLMIHIEPGYSAMAVVAYHLIFPAESGL